MSTRSRLDEVGARLAGELDEPPETSAVLDLLTRSASVSVPGFDSASVSMRDHDGQIRTLSAIDELACEVDRLQYELREGPAYDVISGTHSTIVTYMDDEARWPRFAPRAARLGVGSMMSFELTERADLRSALNLYSLQGGSLEPDAVGIAELFAAHAATTLGLIERVGDLETALRSRTTIGQAVGLTMERYGVSHDRAFGFLVRLSQDSNVKLRDVASDMVDQHDGRAGDTRPHGEARPTA